MGMNTAKRNVLKVTGRSFWDRLECEIRLHMEKQEKPPLTWLNPCSNVCIDGNYESAISIRVSDIHEFTSISNKETKENISNSIGNPKHLSDTVAFAMNEMATLSQVRRRVNKELVRNAKAYKIPKRILGKDLCNAIEYACGLIEDIPANSDEAEINDDEQNMCKLPENKMEELRLLLGNIDASVGKYPCNTLQDPMHDDLDQRLPIDELSPNTKFMYDLRSPKGKRNYEKGLIDGLKIAKQRQRQDDEQRVSECDDTSSAPSCSTAVDTHVKRPRRQLRFADGTIGVVNIECNSVKNNTDTDTVDDLCVLCHRKWPPNMKGMTASWVQCNSCNKWFH
ncbi:Hypothetical predicted protein, partial [Paramuricea clavata]